MKILYTNFHKYHLGGHATYILNLYAALKDKHQIHIADPATSGLHEAVKKISPEIIFAQDYPKRLPDFFKMLKSAKQLRALIKKNQYDLIHVNGSPDLQLSLLACFGLKHKPAMVYTKHNTLPISRNIFSRYKFKSAQHIIAVCGYLQPAFEAIGIPKRQLSVIKNGIDTERFSPATREQRQAMRAQLGLTDQDLVVFSSAGTAPYKRWECMIEAVSKIPNPHIKIVFVGGAPSHEEQARRVGAFTMTDRVIFVGNVTDTRPYVAAGDMGFLLSDHIEAVPFACREMMSMGLPMLLTNYACLPENVTPGVNGWLVKTGDIDAIKAVVEWAFEHRDQLPAMGEKAREQAVRQFGIQLFADQTEAVYQKACKRRSKSDESKCR